MINRILVSSGPYIHVSGVFVNGNDVNGVELK